MAGKRTLIGWTAGLLLVATAGFAAAGNAGLLPDVRTRIADTAGIRGFDVDCTYNALSGGLAVAYPAWNGAPARVYTRPWICTAVNRAYRRSWRGADRTGKTAYALLVLTHEAIHLSGYPGARDERLTECEALRLLPAVARRLGAPEQMVPTLEMWAGQAHAKLVREYPSYGGGCEDSGAGR
ncbi:MAG: hypothetical protein NUW01_12960 [Gemmatimonadaceae bacterium]|nr:hypothetical protein [Gemmatimonadaceae bacterium]